MWVWWGVGGVKKFEEYFRKFELDPTPQTPFNSV